MQSSIVDSSRSETAVIGPRAVSTLPPGIDRERLIEWCRGGVEVFALSRLLDGRRCAARGTILSVAASAIVVGCTRPGMRSVVRPAVLSFALLLSVEPCAPEAPRP